MFAKYYKIKKKKVFFFQFICAIIIIIIIIIFHNGAVENVSEREKSDGGRKRKRGKEGREIGRNSERRDR